MMLSVFYSTTVIPGRSCRDADDLVYALYIALILLNVIVLAFLTVSTGALLRIIRIPTRFLGMLI
jgi:Tripartite tricarboxylate transporter TctA family.